MTRIENTTTAATEPDEKTSSSFVAVRRQILGALAIGAVATACSSTDETLQLVESKTPGGLAQSASSAATPSGAAQVATDPALALATGPELDVISLPFATDPVGTSTDGQPAAPEENAVTDSAAAPADSVPGDDAMTVDPSGVVTSADSVPGDDAMTVDLSGVVTSADSVPSDDAVTILSEAPVDPAAPVGSAAPAVAVTPTTTAVADVLLANRITFGVNPAVLADIKRLGSDGFIEDQLGRTSADAALEPQLAKDNYLLRLNKQEVAGIADKSRFRINHQLSTTALARAVSSRSQLFEHMGQLWMDHFNIGRIRPLEPYLFDYQENAIRPHAMGSFRGLLKATANSSVMMVSLDNHNSNANSRQGVNENYGRELLELHTLGIDSSDNHVYTEDDIRSASLAMSGWSADTNAGKFVYKSDYHHTGDISLLNGAWTRSGTTGKATGDSLLDFLASHPSTARHVASRICRRFVSDSPSQTLINSTAAVYLANDTEIVPTLRHVLKSAEFASSGGKKLRRPFEHVAAIVRALGVTLPENPYARANRQLMDALENMGHSPWNWPNPDGYPDYAAAWLTTDNLSNRVSLGALMARNKMQRLTVDYESFRASSGSVGDLIDTLSLRFGIGGSTSEIAAAIAKGAKLEVGAAADSLSDAQMADIIGLVLAHPIFQTR